jgi:hypothetical protein
MSPDFKRESGKFGSGVQNQRVEIELLAIDASPDGLRTFAMAVGARMCAFQPRLWPKGGEGENLGGPALMRVARHRAASVVFPLTLDVLSTCFNSMDGPILSFSVNDHYRFSMDRFVLENKGNGRRSACSTSIVKCQLL